MDAETYRERTRETWRDDDSRSDQIMHAAAGIVGEAGEVLSTSHNSEELGDLMYYTVRLRDLLDRSFVRVPVSTQKGDPLYLGAKIVERAKKHRYQGKDPTKYPKWVGHGTAKILAFVAHRAEYVHDMTMRELRQQNIEKLTDRYPDGFEKGGGRRD